MPILAVPKYLLYSAGSSGTAPGQVPPQIMAGHARQAAVRKAVHAAVRVQEDGHPAGLSSLQASSSDTSFTCILQQARCHISPCQQPSPCLVQTSQCGLRHHNHHHRCPHHKALTPCHGRRRLWWSMSCQMGSA